MAAGQPAGFTVDGPRGPARVAQPGAVWLAKATGNPVLPFHLEADRHWTLNSWDRTQIPKPFSTVAIVIGEPFYVPRDAERRTRSSRHRQRARRAARSRWSRVPRRCSPERRSRDRLDALIRNDES